MSEELKGENKKYENSLAEVPENQIEKDESKSAKSQETIQYMIIIKNTLENLDLGVRCEFDNPENPTALLIYDKDNKFVTAITKENGLDANVSDLANKIARLLDASYKEFPEGVQKLLQGAGNQKYLNGKELPELDGEELQKLNGKTGFEMLSDEEKLALQGKIEKGIDLNEEDIKKLQGKVKKEKTKEDIESELKENTGVEYEILGRITECGNEEIMSKIHETEGFVGNIYKVKNKSTGEISIAGTGSKGEMKEATFRRIPAPAVEVIKYRADGSIDTSQKSYKSKELIVLPNSDIALDATDKELSAIANYNSKNPQSYQMDVEPATGRSTTTEIDEAKQNPEKVKEVVDLLKQIKGITSEEIANRLSNILRDGEPIDTDIEQLKKEIENQDKQEKEQKDDFDESQYDPRDPYFQMEQRLRRERDINN